VGGLWIDRVEEMGFEVGLEQGEGLTEVLGEGVPELWGCHKAPEFGPGGGKQTMNVSYPLNGKKLS